MEEIVRVYHPSLETVLTLSPEAVQVLIVENPQEFYHIVTMLDTQLSGGEGEFSFLREEKPILAEKEGCIICDPFHFDLNDRQVVNLLIKRLAELCKCGELYPLLSRVNGEIERFFSELFSVAALSLTHDDFSIEGLLKGGSVRFERTYDTLSEKIICYINTMVTLKNCRFFLFVNLRGVLNNEALRALYHHCALEKVGLLLLENCKVRPLLPEEKAVIITEDLCEILENYSEK